jgi:hypothetical protein
MTDMSVSPDHLVDVVGIALTRHFVLEGHYEWLDRTTMTRSYEWQIYPEGNDRPSVAGECYLTFQKDEQLMVDLRATIEFRDIDRLRSTELLARAREHLERAYVEYRIVEEFADERQSFHVSVATARSYDEDHLEDEDLVAEDMDLHLEALASLAREVDRMVYLESSGIG